MGLLVPTDFDLRTIENGDEREVVGRLVDGLTDGWLIFPNVTFHSDRPHEIDVVLLHEEQGVVHLEVKGHRVYVQAGDWYGRQGKMKPQPFSQAKTNAYALRDELKDRWPGVFDHFPVRFGVAFPNTTELHGHLPPDIKRSQLFLAPDLEDPQNAIDLLLAGARIGSRFTVDQMNGIIKYLKPDTDFSWDPEARIRMHRQRMEALCASQVRALERLDANRRVVVTGGAGSGKTRLALAWARRASISRNERVLVTCFNEPLADQIQTHLDGYEGVVAGAFLTVARSFEGMPHLEEPENMTAEDASTFWNETVIGHLHLNWPKITEKFDTIIIDEAQDFSPAWIAQLESLLDEDGPRRLMMVADSGQEIFSRGFRMPKPDDGWTLCELVNNCRNSHQIARLLRAFLGGAPAPEIGPETIGIEFDEATTEDYVAKVKEILEREPDNGSGLLAPTASKVVLVPSVKLRDKLRDELGLGSWDERDTKTVCETERRMKGTEFDTVILVDPEFRMDDRALYIGISRAINQLFVVGPKELGQRLRIEKQR
jgi:thymidine kinase